MPLSRRYPALLPLAVRVHRARRHVRWWTSRARWVRRPAGAVTACPVVVAEHASPLTRRLGTADPVLQRNKAVNLRLAAARVDGVRIAPGETLSFNRLVGNCTARKGYLPGMLLVQGQVTSGVGGGLCQLANLLHWLVLHSSLTVVERSEHSFDAFPDQDRVVPWGVGCTIVYNYVDLVVRNDTDLTFGLRTWVGDTHLHGELTADRTPPCRYVVEAREEEFVRIDGEVWRRNEIWRTAYDASGPVEQTLVRRNRARVAYDVPEDRLRGQR